MKCSIIRDLLPLYEIGQCSKETRDIVKEHLKNCNECNMLYNEMHESIDFNEFIEHKEESSDEINILNEVYTSNKKDNEFWRKYYGRMFIKAFVIFISIYVVVNLIGVVFFMKK